MDLLNSLRYRVRALADHLERRVIIRDEALDACEDAPVALLRDLQTVRALVPSLDALVDVGAHRGVFTQVASRFFDLRKVSCVEPNEALHAEIRRRSMGLDVQLHACALADSEARGEFHVHGDSAMSSLVAVDEQTLSEKFSFDDPAEIQSRMVLTRTLDSVFAESAIPEDARVLLKLDTQGNELDILRHGTTALAHARACVIEHMFLTPYRRTYGFAELVTFMADHDFRVACPLNAQRQPSHEVSAVDFLFVRS